MGGKNRTRLVALRRSCAVSTSSSDSRRAAFGQLGLNRQPPRLKQRERLRQRPSGGPLLVLRYWRKAAQDDCVTARRCYTSWKLQAERPDLRLPCWPRIEPPETGVTEVGSQRLRSVASGIPREESDAHLLLGGDRAPSWFESTSPPRTSPSRRTVAPPAGAIRVGRGGCGRPCTRELDSYSSCCSDCTVRPVSKLVD
jgi:hypothetical protein